jgi:hypothetical protein
MTGQTEGIRLPELTRRISKGLGNTYLKLTRFAVFWAFNGHRHIADGASR